MATTRPQFAALWMRFHELGHTAAAVAARLGGAVADEIQSAALRDLGALRLSYALRAGGLVIPSGTHTTLKSADGASYFHRVRDIAPFLAQHFGTADFVVGEHSDRGWSDRKGVLLSRSPLSMRGGFVTLWNGRHGASPVPLAAVRGVQFWTLA